MLRELLNVRNQRIASLYQKKTMMKKATLTVVFAAFAILFASAQSRYITRTGKATIFSHTIAEDISADNNNVSGLIDPSTGNIAISVPVQGFQFEKALMQEHFNQPNFMDSKQYPRISLKAKLANPASVNFGREGSYETYIAGELTIKGVTKPINEKAHITVKDGRISVHCKFTVKDISSYGVGKPMGKRKNNVADDIEVTYTATYETASE